MFYHHGCWWLLIKLEVNTKFHFISQKSCTRPYNTKFYCCPLSIPLEWSAYMHGGSNHWRSDPITLTSITAFRFALFHSCNTGTVFMKTNKPQTLTAIMKYIHVLDAYFTCILHEDFCYLSFIN